MPLRNPNSTPRSIRLLARFAGAWTCVDVGARGGIMGTLLPMEPHVSFIGFDPDADECVRLSRPGHEFLPFALSNQEGPQQFYLTRFPYCHGFAPINADAWRYPNAANNEVIGAIVVDATTIDRVLDEHGVRRVDFMKIDVEGTELAVLHGARETLRHRHVVGVQAELWFGTKDVPTPGDLDRFMREEGFRLYDIEVQRYPRSTLPVGPLNPDGTGPARHREHGQVQTGDALYFRDPIADLAEGRSFAWCDAAVLHLIGLLDVFGYQDVGIELAFAWRDRFTMTIDVDAVVDALVPPLGEEILPYDEYRRRSMKVFEIPAAYLAPGITTTLPTPTYRPMGQR